MNKIYQRIDWENYPSSATPLNEDNLNKMDYAIDKLDDRIVTHETTKLDTATGNSLVKDVTFDETTGIFTIEKLSGSKITINTALEKISTNFHFNPTTQKLVLTLIDGTVQEIDLSALITQYEFLESDTITFEIDASGKVKANILNGSITGEKLEPNYLANVTLQANNAKTSADKAKTSEELAYQYAEEAKESASETQKNDAANISYNSATSGLTSDNVQGAIDEIKEDLENFTITVDDALSTTSTNPVQNKVVTNALNNKSNKSIYGDDSINLGRKADTTVGKKSVAQGYNVTASGGYSLASGHSTTASGVCSYAEGYGTVSDAPRSHAEGEDTKALGRCSHTEGTQTIASSENQHVQGKYNVEDTEEKYAHIVGGGDSTTRKNIHTLDWDGNAEFAGDVKAHDTSGNEVSLLSHTHVVDSALSTTSTNPVQNKVVNSALNNKVDKSSVLSTIEQCTASTNINDIAGASALAELNDSLTLQTATVNVSNTISGATGTFTAYKFGRVCTVVWSNINGLNHASWATDSMIAYLPNGFRPIVEVSKDPLCGGAYAAIPGKLVFHTGGAIQVTSPNAITDITNGCITYITS